MQFVDVDFDQHERLILVEGHRGHLRPYQISLAQLAARAGNEVGDAVLRFDALVQMVVAREHDVDAVLDQQRLEAQPQVDR